MTDSRKIKIVEKFQETDPEQEICLKCGMCCDGTLFDDVKVESGEKDLLPEKIRENYYLVGENERFKLPCPYFRNFCTIYGHPRASTCHGFRCDLLKKMYEKKITKRDAFNIIQNALALRSEIFSIYGQLFRTDNTLSFRKICENLGICRANETTTGSYNKSMKLLYAKCIIFDVLLIRHFKKQKYFQQMIENNQE